MLNFSFNPLDFGSVTASKPRVFLQQKIKSFNPLDFGSVTASKVRGSGREFLYTVSIPLISGQLLHLNALKYKQRVVFGFNPLDFGSVIASCSMMTQEAINLLSFNPLDFGSVIASISRI